MQTRMKTWFFIALSLVVVQTAFSMGQAARAKPGDQTAVPGPDYLQLDITTPELYLDGKFGYAWEGSAEVYKVHVFSRLLWLDSNSKISGGDLASDYKVSADALTYSVTLRDGLKWHDGQPLTIKDVTWSVKATLLDSTAGGLFVNAFRSIVGAKEFAAGTAKEISGMTVSGNIVTFKLSQTSSTFLYVLGQWPILPEHILKAANPTDIYAFQSYWAKPIGCGPYKFVEVVKNEYATMEIYPNYHGKTPGIKKMYMDLTGVNMQNLVPNNKIDFFATQDPGVISYMKNYKNYTRYQVPVNYVRYLMCNTVGKGNTEKGTAVSDFRVRQALLHALDLDVMLGQFYAGMASQTDSKLSNMKSPYHNPKNKMLKYDPVRAKKLLDEAGYDYKYEFTVAYYYGDQVSIDFIQTLKYYWEQIGMKVTPVKLTGDLANLMYYARNYDVMYAGLGFTIPEDTFGQFLDTSIMHQTLGSDPKWQILYDALTTASSEENRIKAAFALQDFEQTKLVQIPLFNLDIAFYVNTARVEVPTQYFTELRMAYNRHFEEWKLKK